LDAHQEARMSDFPTLTVRGQRQDDQEQLLALLSHEALLRDTLEVPYLAEETFRERYANPGPDTHTLILETGLPSGRKSVVGAAWVQPVKRPRRRHEAEVTVAVHPDYRGGAADGALLDAALDLGRSWLGLHRLHTTVFTADVAALALYEARGFLRETLQRAYAVRDGALADAVGLAWVNGLEPAAPPPPPSEPAAPRRLAATSVLIRAQESTDYEALTDLANSGNVAANTMQLPFASLDAWHDRLENPPQQSKFLVAEVKGRVVGMVGLHLQDGRRAHAAWLGMMVHADFQGRGIGTALLAAAVELADRWYNVRRLALEVYPDNRPAVALYQKFGFVTEGTQRDHAFRDGRYVDTLLMARLREGATL